ncbi:MAG: NgoMIV family type II restriction endonuclease [Planctomycetota bacterium]
MRSFISEERAFFHNKLIEKNVLSFDKNGVPSISDKDNDLSVRAGRHIINKIGNAPTTQDRLAGQTAGNLFETICSSFVERTFLQLKEIRPGSWHVRRVLGHSAQGIEGFEQYSHLNDLADLLQKQPDFKTTLGSDYLITPDILVFREPEPDSFFNIDNEIPIVDKHSAQFAPLRQSNNKLPILHASVSCKFTIRSDRAQNARSEALNLIRLRKGRVPHIVVITGEPLASRLASLCMGTGDIDCVYHFALNELMTAADILKESEMSNLLKIMVDGKRLRDIADLPLDLAI